MNTPAANSRSRLDLYCRGAAEWFPLGAFGDPVEEVVHQSYGAHICHGSLAGGWLLHAGWDDWLRPVHHPALASVAQLARSRQCGLKAFIGALAERSFAWGRTVRIARAKAAASKREIEALQKEAKDRRGDGAATARWRGGPVRWDGAAYYAGRWWSPNGTHWYYVGGRVLIDPALDTEFADAEFRLIGGPMGGLVVE